MEEFKSYHEIIDWYRIYSNSEFEEVEREMQEIEQDIAVEARAVFRDTSEVSALMFAIRTGLSEERCLKRIERLEIASQEAGDIAGHWLRPGSRAAAAARLPYLADRLRDFADLARVRQGYEHLHQRAVEALQLPASRKAEAVEALRHERDYADTVRDTRENDRENRSRNRG